MRSIILNNKIAIAIILTLSTTAANSQTADTTNVALDDVVVTGTRYASDIRHLPMTISIISRTELIENQQTNILPTLTEQVPGLFVTSRGMMGYGVSTGAAGGISLRGLAGSSGQLLVLIDGHPQYSGIYGHPIGDSYQTMMAERVEVLRGPASVLYGSNAMGGVINIVTRHNSEDGVQTHVNMGAGSYGTFKTEADNLMRSGKFSSTAAVQYSRTDNHRPRMGFEQYGGYMKLGYDIATNWNAYTDINLTHFNASYPGSTSTPMYEADQWITRGMMSAAIENHYKSASGALSVYCNFGRHKINDGYAEGKEPQTRLFRSKDALTGISIYQSVNLFSSNRITGGVDWQNIYGNAYYTDRQTGEVLETQNKQSARKQMNEVAAYIDVRQELTTWFTIDAGIRYDNHSVSGSEWIPQAGVVVRPFADGQLKTMVSKGFRNPTLREMYLYPPSNEELHPERIVNYELSWKHKLLCGALSYGINLFYINGDNIIQTVERKNVNTGKIENKGIEIEASWQANNNLTISTNHSYLDMKHPVLAAPVYKGYAGAFYKADKLSLSVSLQYINGLYKSVGDNNKQEDFTLLNASAGYKIHNNIELSIKGENLLAQEYEINLGYPMPRTTFMCNLNVHF